MVLILLVSAIFDGTGASADLDSLDRLERILVQ